MTKHKKSEVKDLIQPKFLEYVCETFERWQKLFEEGITLGSREIARFENVIKGAKLNSKGDFEYMTFRNRDDSEGKSKYALWIFESKEAVEKGIVAYDFEVQIFD